MARIRLQKLLARAGICSRRKGEAYIRDGRVTVNQAIVTQLGTQVDPDIDAVAFDGRPVSLTKPALYIALNKPAGYVTTCHQPGDRIVLDLVDIPERLFPVGRLDKDSTGLVLLTNDGRIHHQLLHPSFDHEKEYRVSLEKPISDRALRRMAAGMELMGSTTRPARVKRLASDRFRIVLKEGKNRQIRRMVAKVGGRVKTLKRIRIANIRLGTLPPGKWRFLSAWEQKGLLKGIKTAPAKGEAAKS